MSNLPGANNASALVFSRSFKAQWDIRAELQKVRKIRDEIAAKIQDWLASLPVEQRA